MPQTSGPAEPPSSPEVQRGTPFPKLTLQTPHLLFLLTGLGSAESPQKWPQQDFLDISASEKVLVRFQEAVTDMDPTLGCIRIQMRRILADQSNVVHETVWSNFLVKNNRKKNPTIKILRVEFPYKKPGEDRNRELAADSIHKPS